MWQEEGTCQEQEGGQVDIEEAYGEICARWRSLPPAEKRICAEALSVPFTYGSTKTENDEIALSLVESLAERGVPGGWTGSSRAVHEAENHLHAWQKIIRLALGEEPPLLSMELLLEVQRLLTEHAYDADRWEAGERPGMLKQHDYGVGIDAEVGFAPDECAAALDGLIEEVNPYLQKKDISVRNALTCATYFHAMLADIHPFADGNGRCARMMQNYILLVLGHPPIAQREQDRIAYYGALDAFHSEGNLSDLIAFNKAEVCASWSGLLD